MSFLVSKFFRYRLRWAGFALVVLLAIELTADDESWKNLLPEAVGAVATWFLVELFWKGQAYDQFRKEMLSLRRSVRKMVDGKTLTPEQAQETVAVFVPAMSRVFFDGRESPPSSSTLQILVPNESDIRCDTCTRTVPVVNGNCARCRDPLKSWVTLSKE